VQVHDCFERQFLLDGGLFIRCSLDPVGVFSLYSLERLLSSRPPPRLQQMTEESRSLLEESGSRLALPLRELLDAVFLHIDQTQVGPVFLPS